MSSAVNCLIIGLSCLFLLGEAKAPLLTRHEIFKYIINSVQSANIESFHRVLTSVPHVAGTAEDLEQAQWLRDRWIQAGLDDVEIVPYRVLLSYPNRTRTNKVQLLSADEGEVLFTTRGTQPPLTRGEESNRILPNFNAFSANGTVEGELVYANFGRDEDFQALDNLGANLTGKIVIARLGAVFRGSIAGRAESRGAVGLILYGDPQEHAVLGRHSVYPANAFLPGHGVQFGTIATLKGDYSTPMYPSLESAFRLDESEMGLPKILVQTIGYDEAGLLLRSIPDDNPSPKGWRGGLNVSYSLFSRLQKPKTKVRMEISNTNQMAVINNVIGILRGSHEPDRYVIIGNHRDAWNFGAVDPSSGTASLMEVVRVLGNLRKLTGWRPRRSLVFCSWSGEEFGLIGSTEWVEQHRKILEERAVAYLNIDIAMDGIDSFLGKSVPSLRRLLKNVAKMVPNPNQDEINAGRESVFDTWALNVPDPVNAGQPSVRHVGSSSDFESFLYTTGIASADMYYTQVNSAIFPAYPVYHTLYDTYHLVKELLDPGYHYQRAVARILGLLAVDIADSEVLPFHLTDYANFIADSFAVLQQKSGHVLENNGVHLGYLAKAVGKLQTAAAAFHESLSCTEPKNFAVLRRKNDQLMHFERHFINQNIRGTYRHLILTPTKTEYNGAFGNVARLMGKVQNATRKEEPKLWRELEAEVAAIAFHLDEAANSLDDNGLLNF